MLENITRLFPAISLVLVATLSIFNIGYLWRFGIHYLGIIDLSNVVYSFGLAVIVLMPPAIFIPKIMRQLFQPLSGSALLSAMRKIKLLMGIGGLIVSWGVFNVGGYL
jgi:hypothetical protein